MSTDTPDRRAGALTRLRPRFRDWRGHRPFWAGLFTLLGGMPIAYFPYATLKLGHMSLVMATTAGAGSLIIGVLLITLGLTMWFQQATRVFAGVASILLALVSLVVSNMGGLGVGFLLALVGGALALSWVPVKPQAEGGGFRRRVGGLFGNGGQKDACGSTPAGTGTGQPHPSRGTCGGGGVDGVLFGGHDRGQRAG